MSAKAIHPEARHAVSGAMLMAAGHLLTAVVGVATSIVVPRVLGPSDYGHWIMYRSIITTMVVFCMLGTGEVMTYFFIPKLAAGEQRAAGQIFKSVVLVRMLAIVVGAGAGFGMLMAAGGVLADPFYGLCLALSTISQGIQVSFLLLLYAQRRFMAAASVNLLQAAVLPSTAAVAYALQGWALVPPGCALADLFFAFYAAILAQPQRVWARGWLPLRDYRRLFRFGLAVALSGILFNVFSNVVPYLMGLCGYAPSAVGYLGLGTRVSGFVLGALGSIAGAIWPTLSILYAREGLDRVARWQALSTRFGALLVLLVLGEFLLIGPLAVPRVWGAAFGPVTAVMAVCLTGAFFLWTGGQRLRMLLLMGRPRMYLRAVIVLLACFGVPFLALRPDAAGLHTAWSMLIGTVAYGLCGVLALEGRGGLRRMATTYLLPALAVAGAWWAGQGLTSPLPALAAAAGWGLGFVGLVFVCRIVRWHEVRNVWHTFRQAPPPAAGSPPEGGVPPEGGLPA